MGFPTAGGPVPIVVGARPVRPRRGRRLGAARAGRGLRRVRGGVRVEPTSRLGRSARAPARPSPSGGAASTPGPAASAARCSTHGDLVVAALVAVNAYGDVLARTATRSRRVPAAARRHGRGVVRQHHHRRGRDQRRAHKRECLLVAAERPRRHGRCARARAHDRRRRRARRRRDRPGRGADRGGAGAGRVRRRAGHPIGGVTLGGLDEHSTSLIGRAHGARGARRRGVRVRTVQAGRPRPHPGRVRHGRPRCRPHVRRRGPGAEEDKQGLPFVGRSGQLLDKLMLEEIGITRDQCLHRQRREVPACRATATRSRTRSRRAVRGSSSSSSSSTRRWS